ncbi:hypothetical protein WA158_008394 [Blastocystis sp. Blastoise]
MLTFFKVFIMLELKDFILRISCDLKAIIRSTTRIVHFVVGNEGADADSIISSIAYSYFLSNFDVNPNIVYAPIIQLKKEDYIFRPEVSSLLSQYEIDLNHIASIYDVDMKKLHNENRLRLSLVDHNVLTKLMENYSNDIVDILDHRKDIGLYPSIERNNRLISFNRNEDRGVASCCTLIGYKYINQYLSTHPFTDYSPIDTCIQRSITEHNVMKAENWKPIQNVDIDIKTIGYFLSSVILLDAINFDPSLKRGTDLDLYVLSVLQRYIDTSFTRESMYTFIYNKKNDQSYLSSMTALQLLKYDFKLFSVSKNSNNSCPYGWSSLPISISQFYKKPMVLKACQDFMSRNTIYFLILTDITDEPKARHLSILYNTQYTNLLQQIISTPIHSLILQNRLLQCKEISSNPIIYEYNIEYSRKRLNPILIDMIKTYFK